MFTQPGKWSDSNKDGWWETVLRIPLDPAKECGCAHFRIFFEGPNKGMNVNVGNSPTNNGHGGDAGTTPDSAEVQVLSGKLSVYSRIPSLASGPSPLLDRLLDLDLPPLAGRVLAMEVCDQSIAFELSPGKGETKPLRWKLQTLNSGLLYVLSPRIEDGPKALNAEHAIYASFNRVIHQLDGLPSHGRAGTGVRRVEITLSP